MTFPRPNFYVMTKISSLVDQKCNMQVIPNFQPKIIREAYLTSLSTCWVKIPDIFFSEFLGFHDFWHIIQNSITFPGLEIFISN